MANISAIKLPNGTTYDLKDNGALQLTGGQVTGPVTFGDASFTNNIQANTINGVTVGSSPQFTDTNTEVSTLTLLAGNTAGTSLTYGGKFTLTAGSKTVSFTMPASDNTDEKLKTTETTATTGYLIFGGSSSAAGTKNFSYSYKINVDEDDGEAVLEVGRIASVDGGLGLYNTNSGLSFLWANSAGSGGHIYLPSQPGTLALTSDIPTVPSNIVNTITTTAGAHTAITSQKGNVSFNIPTTAAHVGAASSSHTHGNITNGGDITATAPTIASGDQLIINDHSASKITNGPTFDGSTTTTALTPKGTWETFSKFSGSYNDLSDKPTQTSTTATLTTTWSSNQQSVTVSGVTTSNTIIVTPAPASYDAYCEAGIYCSAQAANSLTFKCSTVPASSLTVNIMILE